MVTPTILMMFTLAQPQAAPAPTQPSASPHKGYAAAIRDLQNTRARLRRRYERARTRKARHRVLDEASRALYVALKDQLLPAWYGTRWAFSGTSRHPGVGHIACGTFVGTVLEASGFRLDRIAIGRLASEHIALSLTSERNLKRYSNRPVETVEDDIVRWGPGLYMVGLDRHAGLIVVDEAGTPHFVHSSYVGEAPVVRSEPLQGGDNPFEYSRYRVIAKLLDREMTKKWLFGAWFEAKKS